MKRRRIEPSTAPSPPSPECAAASSGAAAVTGELTGSDVDDGLAYVLGFVAKRVAAGSTVVGVIAEFRVPPAIWETAPPTTQAAAAALIHGWLSLPDGDAGGATTTTSRTVMGEGGVEMLEVSFATDGGGASWEAQQATLQYLQVKSVPVLGPSGTTADAGTAPGTSAWEPSGSGLKVVLNVELDAAAVPSAVAAGGTAIQHGGWTIAPPSASHTPWEPCCGGV